MKSNVEENKMTNKDKLKKLATTKNKLLEDQEKLNAIENSLLHELDDMTDIIEKLEEIKSVKNNMKSKQKEIRRRAFTYVLEIFASETIITIIPYTLFALKILSNGYDSISGFLIKLIALIHISYSLIGGVTFSMLDIHSLKKQVKELDEEELNKLEKYRDNIINKLNEIVHKLEINKQMQAEVEEVIKILYDNFMESKVPLNAENEVVEEVKREEEKGMTLERRKKDGSKRNN